MADVTISLAPPGQQAEALALLAGATGDAQLAESSTAPPAESPAIPLDGLLIATAGRTVLGAVLYVLQPGGVAFVWPPAVKSGEDRDDLGLRLLHEIARRIDAAGCRLGQCLIEPESAVAALLERTGFPRLTELLYLERPLDAPLPIAPSGRLNAVSYDASNHDRFAALLEATYAGTLDCPELNGVRTTDETLAGHRGAGHFNPALWKLYTSGRSDVGLMLVAEHPALRTREIVYMGVVPAARGQGVGRIMLAEAIHDARQSGCEALLLAVDNRNHYARMLYEENGFAELCRRAVHLRVRG